MVLEMEAESHLGKGPGSGGEGLRGTQTRIRFARPADARARQGGSRGIAELTLAAGTGSLSPTTASGLWTPHTRDERTGRPNRRRGNIRAAPATAPAHAGT